MAKDLTQVQNIRIRRNVPNLKQTKRTKLFDTISKLNIGDGIEVKAENYSKIYIGCRWACDNKEQFKGWKFGSMKTENGYIIKRIA